MNDYPLLLETLDPEEIPTIIQDATADISPETINLLKKTGTYNRVAGYLAEVAAGAKTTLDLTHPHDALALTDRDFLVLESIAKAASVTGGQALAA